MEEEEGELKHDIFYQFLGEANSNDFMDIEKI